MVRKLDEGKVRRVIRCLIKHRKGIWLRNLARECRLSVSTASFYVDKVLKDVVESIGVKDGKGRYVGLRILRIKPEILKVLESEGGGDEGKIINFIKLLRKV